MRRSIAVIGCCALLVGCASLKSVRPALAPAPWETRVVELRRASSWRLDGRAAVAFGQQGWQASLDWQQSEAVSELHLAGPFGAGALDIKLTPAGVSLNGAPPSDEVVTQLEDRLGFEPPLENLRYWLLGIPDPGSDFELTRNAQDRAAHLSQAGWTVDYDAYLPSQGDLLPGRLVLRRAEVRVRIAIDRWETLK
ncbi:MAG TPA: lipoprotein insertase outer membrane protein LolB [Steroidobacteraceae bacterium]|nr:lipoprotein insertase outer membrane protein LolB [Steroidobacteraceae bacterium]